jgi:hypothetical protein
MSNFGLDNAPQKTSLRHFMGCLKYVLCHIKQVIMLYNEAYCVPNFPLLSLGTVIHHVKKTDVTDLKPGPWNFTNQRYLWMDEGTYRAQVCLTRFDINYIPEFFTASL